MIKSYQQFLDEAVIAKGLADDILDETYNPLNEDYAQQAAVNQEHIQNLADSSQGIKDKVGELTQKLEAYKDKAGKTEDAATKEIYSAKMSTGNARKEAYLQYDIYLKSMAMYYQAKGQEIELRAKEVEKGKL